MVAWPFFHQMMKNSHSPLLSWINQQTPKANAALSGLVALLTTAGFHLMGDAQHGWILTIPSLVAMGHVAGQWLGQHIIYQTAISGPTTQKLMLAELQKLNGQKNG